MPHGRIRHFPPHARGPPLQCVDEDVPQSPGIPQGFPATVKHSVLTHQRVFVTTPVKSIGNDLSTGAGAGFGWLLLMINVTAMVWFAVTFSNV